MSKHSAIALLTSPSSAVRDDVSRGSAQLLSACLLFMALVFGVLDAVLVTQADGYKVPVPGYVFLLLSYVLSRTKHYMWGAVLGAAMFPLVGIAQLVTGQGQLAQSLNLGPILFSMIGPFFAGIFLGVRGSAALALINMVWLSIGGVLLLDRYSMAELAYPLAANAVAAAVAVLYALHRDWSEERRRCELEAREKQLQRLQTMEALGRMAGGIAHDFNNLLTVISGAAELLSEEAESKEVKLIESAVESAKDLTTQLLGLSRQNVVKHSSTDLHRFMVGMRSFLSRLIGEDIEISVQVERETFAVDIPAPRLQQILLNLGTNARDAMPKGGKLQILAQNHDDDYVEISVTDSGAGMDEETKTRVFEPFYTTKKEGKGTGLGLSMVFGVVDQYGGHVDLESEPGLGATFKIYLPRAERGQTPEDMARRTVLSGQNEGMILVVEDSAQVREVCRVSLRRAGYQVVAAANPVDGLALFEEHRDTLILVVSDLVMPIMRGSQMVEQMREKRPALPVLFISGYAPEDVCDGEIDGKDLLTKPFTPAEFVSRVRQALGALDSLPPPRLGSE